MGADPYYSLMEILNPEENCNFVDHYLDIKVDFSEVIFILTANDILHMLEPLRNRLEIIEIPPYIQQEKLEIAKNYLIPKLNENYKYSDGVIKFSNEDLNQIIKGTIIILFFTITKILIYLTIFYINLYYFRVVLQRRRCP